jgi:excisionase family DNA binding protein
METQVLPQLHTLGAVSARTSMSRSALYREIKSGRLSALKIGKSLRVSEEDLQAFIGSLQKTKSAV